MQIAIKISEGLWDFKQLNGYFYITGISSNSPIYYIFTMLILDVILPEIFFNTKKYFNNSSFLTN